MFHSIPFRLIFFPLLYLHVEIWGSPQPSQNDLCSKAGQNNVTFPSNSQIPFRQNDSTVLLKAERAIQGPQTIQEYQRGYGLKRRMRGHKSFPPYTDRIVGGTQAKPHEFPHQVYLLEYNHFFCGGSIISKWLILTAAHCLRNVNVSALTVTAGAHDKSNPSGLEQIRTVDEMVVHPNYTRAKKDHDIAILVLGEPLSLSAAVRSIRLSNLDVTFSGNTTVSGWGNTASGGTSSNVLKKVTVPIVPNSQCDFQYANITITEQMFCAGEEGQDACQGDSGGPALCTSRRWGFSRSSSFLCGIVSFGKGCGRAGYPGVYVNVSKYIGWILGVLNNRILENDCLRDRRTPSNIADWTKCATKYVLPEASNTPCGTSDEEPGFLLVTNDTSALRIDLSQMGIVESAPSESSTRYLKAVDFDLKNDYLYWVDTTSDAIRRLHMNGNGQPEILVRPQVTHFGGLAFDWMSGNLYFTDNLGSKIGVIRTNGASPEFRGKMRKVLLKWPDVRRPWGITVHPEKGYIFWTDEYDGDAFIGRAHLDGSHSTKILSGDNSRGSTTPILEDPRGIALDYVENRIYWVDDDLGRIMTADLNGDDVKIVLQADTRILRPRAVGIYKNKVYWTDQPTRALYRASLRHDKTVKTNSISEIVGSNGDKFGLKVYGVGSQQGENLCTNSNCRYICMVSPAPSRSVSCLCPDGFTKQSNDTCV